MTILLDAFYYIQGAWMEKLTPVLNWWFLKDLTNRIWQFLMESVVHTMQNN